MGPRTRRAIRFLLLCLSALQFALPAAASVFDGSIAQSSLNSGAHVEDVGRNACKAPHSPDCVVCRFLSVTFTQAAATTVVNVERSISVPPTTFVPAYSGASRQGFQSRAPPTLLS